jgi:hypothetical protein
VPHDGWLVGRVGGLARRGPALDTRKSLSDSERPMTPFERGLIAHLVADWILQNDWMARNKTCLRHPAAWTHAGIHAVCLAIALGWMAGLVLGFVHLLIDTRVPVNFWMRHFKRCQGAANAETIAVWLDQVLHVVCIALWLALTGG